MMEKYSEKRRSFGEYDRRDSSRPDGYEPGYGRRDREFGRSSRGERTERGERAGRGERYDRRKRNDEFSGTDTGEQEQKENFLFGMRPVIEALSAGKKIDKVYFRKGMEGDLFKELLDLVTENNVPFQFVPVEKLNKFTSSNHQGVVAVIPKVDYVEFGEILPRVISRKQNPVFLLLDGITDVRNFGAIVRTAECCGISAVLVPSKGAAAINADAIKTSAGALLRVDTCKVPTLKKAIAELKEAGVRIVAATEKSEVPVYSEDFSGPLAIVMGSESKGISEGVLELCDVQVRIPMMGSIGSLNVSVATGVILFEVVRQRVMSSETK